MVMEQNKKLLIPYSLNIKQNDAEMSLSDHLEELRQRAFWSVAVLISSILLCVFIQVFINVYMYVHVYIQIYIYICIYIHNTVYIHI